MLKRKLRSNSALEDEKEEDARPPFPQSTSKNSPGSKKGPPIKKQKIKPLTFQTSSPEASEKLFKHPVIQFNKFLPLLTVSQQSTISSILTIISKSLCGLRLRQNLVTLKQIVVEYQPYASAIFRSSLLADRLLAFRTSGPSFSAIKSTLFHSGAAAALAPEVNALFIIRWIIMRLFAFGHPALITTLGTAQTPQDVLDAREAYKESSGLGVNSLPAYGNVRFDPKRVPGYVNRVFVGGLKLFDAMVEARKMGDGVISFNGVMGLIEEAAIPYHSSGTIFQWLLACDLAELGETVAPPTARDLACRINYCAKKKKGGSGAWNGLAKGIEEEDRPRLTVDNLIDHLGGIYWGVKVELGTQESPFGERGFRYSDLEHCLCKVVRAARY